MPDINWGGDATSAPFKSFFDETDGNLVIAEDTNGETRLLEWDGTAWQVRGPVELNGEDVSGVGTLSATGVVSDSVSTEQANINGPLDAESATVGEVRNDGILTGVERWDDTVEGGVGTTETSLSLLKSNNSVYKVYYRMKEDTAGDTTMTINKETGTVYDYEDNSGTEFTGENEVTLFDSLNTFSTGAGIIHLSHVRDRIGFHHIPMARIDRANPVAVYGTLDTSGLPDSIEFQHPELTNAGDFRAAAAQTTNFNEFQ